MTDSELDVRRREWNRRFRAAYVNALGPTGDDATGVQAEVVGKLDAGEA
jgi:hypothetical protein